MAAGRHELDPPLRIDWLTADDVDDGRPGRLGLTFLPGKHGPSLRYPGRVYRRQLDADLATLRENDVARLLLLVEDAELARWGDPALVQRAAEHGVVIDRRPMPDGGTPASAPEMDEILDRLAEGRMSGNVAVACMGGVGRTGLVAACALVRTGWTTDDAIARVRHVRHPEAVETQGQVAFVRAYERHVAQGPGSARVAP